MSRALVEITYSSDSGMQLIRIDSEEELSKRLVTLKENDNVVQIRVFLLNTTFTRTTAWTQA